MKKEVLALIIAIARIAVAIVLMYWAIKYAMSAIKFFNAGYDSFKSVTSFFLTAISAKTPLHL